MIDTKILRKRLDSLQHWYRDSFTEFELRSAAGTSLRAAYRRQKDKGTLVIVTGRTEFIEKYLEVCRDLSDLQYSICIYDHCGQGGSGRLLDDPQKGYIDRFNTYVQDLGRVIDHLEGQGFPLPVMLLGHSMGATIATLSALRCPEQVSRLLLCSPMFGIQTGVNLPDFVVKLLVASACRLGLGDRYAPTVGPYEATREFHDNALTSDRFRFEYNRYLTEHLGFVALGGPTIRWLHESFKAMRMLRHSARAISVPVLSLVAAGDRVIDAGAAAGVNFRSRKSIYHEYPVNGHELLMEQDETRNDVLLRIKKYMSDR